MICCGRSCEAGSWWDLTQRTHALTALLSLGRKLRQHQPDSILSRRNKSQPIARLHPPGFTVPGCAFGEKFALPFAHTEQSQSLEAILVQLRGRATSGQIRVSTAQHSTAQHQCMISGIVSCSSRVPQSVHHGSFRWSFLTGTQGLRGHPLAFCLVKSILCLSDPDTPWNGAHSSDIQGGFWSSSDLHLTSFLLSSSANH